MRRAGRGQIILLAFGDFAFNLYWQSAMLFLVFYYTDALRLPVAAASLTYLVASIWDGIVNLAAGLFIEGRGRNGYRRWLLLGAAPLGASFILAYLPPPIGGGWALAIVLVGHLLFRTAYAAINIPYLAMSARVSADSGDRTLLAGLRMLFGTGAGVLVALGTVPIGTWASGGQEGAGSYFAAAVLFAALGTAILALVGATVRETPQPAMAERRPPLLASLRALAANRAFFTLNVAMMAMIAGVTLLEKSILYYFKYHVGDESAGRLALGSMAALSAVALPVWIVIGRRIGARAVWLLAAGLAVAGMALFAAIDIRDARAMQGFLIAMQAAIIGLHFAYWAMLPDTIEYGEHAHGLRVEGAVFGVAALLQRVAIGLATGLMGLMFGASGYVADARLSAQTLTDMRWTIAGVPLVCLVLAALAMLANPLRRGAHARILSDLAGRRDQAAVSVKLP